MFIVKYEDMKFCQSCTMPMCDEHFASEKESSKVKITVNIAIKMENLLVMFQ